MMDLEQAIAYCLDRPEVAEETPFGPDVLVYKVRGKMFALAIPDEVPPRMNLKCDPDKAESLRDEHEAIIPGYHMNKRHWNTVIFDGSLPDGLVREMIDDSFRLVIAGLKKADREALRELWPG